MQIQKEYGVRRVYQTTPGENGAKAIRLSDQIVELGAREFDLYSQVAAWLPTQEHEDVFCQRVGIKPDKLAVAVTKLAEAGLFYRQSDVPRTVTGPELHQHFQKILPSWLAE